MNPLNFKKQIDIIAVFLFIIIAIILTYLYPVNIAITMFLIMLGGWFFITGIFRDNKTYEAFIKTSTYSVIIGGFFLIIGATLLVHFLIEDIRITLITLTATITLTTLVALYTEES